jgi:pimeloyl-ACP methyl ester carboxylesterase
MSHLRFRSKLATMSYCNNSIDTTTPSNTESKYSGMNEFPVIFGCNGINLYGKITIPEQASANNPVPGAVFCHGFGSDHKVMESSAQLLAKKGIATIVFDFRGHGRSEGQLDGNFAEDAIDAWGALTGFPEVDSSRVAFIGHSLGAISSILAARKIKSSPKAIIALSCPSEVRGTKYETLPGKLLQFIRRLAVVIGKHVVLFSGMKVNIDWKKFLESWLQINISSALMELEECAKLFVFSDKDPLSPYSRFAPIYETIPGRKQKMVTRGSHVTPVRAEIIRYEWIGWVVSALNGPK